MNQKQNPLTLERNERVPVGERLSWQGAALVGQRHQVRQVDRHPAQEGDNRYRGRRGTWEDAGQSTARKCLIEESGRGTDRLIGRKETPSTPFSRREHRQHRTASCFSDTTTGAFAGQELSEGLRRTCLS